MTLARKRDIPACPGNSLGGGSRTFRSGFVLPVIVVLMLVLAVYFATMGFLSRGQVQSAQHYLDSSLAVNLADAGVRWAMQELSSGTFDSAPAYVPKEFYTHLFSPTLQDWQGEIKLPPCVEEYRIEVGKEGHPALLTLKARLFGLAALPTDAGSGVKPNPVEKSGRLQVEAVATVGNSVRKVTVTRGLKVFRMVHPVLSKFSLFVKLPPLSNTAAVLNPLHRRTTAPGFSGNLKPIEIVNGPSFPVVQGDNLAFPSGGLGDAAMAKIESEAGWIYLGGNQTWSFGLSGEGGGERQFDDRTFLRYLTMVNDDPALTSWGGPLIAKGGASRITQFKIGLEGLRDDYPTTKGPKPLSDLLFTRFIEPLDTGVGLLRLFGSAAEPTPTIVFGPVERRFLHVKSINVMLGTTPVLGVGVPGFPSEAKFTQAFTNPPSPYAGDFNYFRILMEMDPVSAPWSQHYSRFQSAMTRIATESYNAGLDYLLSNQETGPIANPQSPSGNVGTIPDRWAKGLKFWRGTGGNVQESVRTGEGTILDAQGREIFGGGLNRLEGIAELLPKVTARFSSEAEFRQTALVGQGNGSSLDLPGIVYVESDLTFDKPLSVSRGGIIIAKGSITIKAPITAPTDPLTLVACERDITIDCPEPQKIQAHLVCLRGIFRSLGPSFHIVGSLAARELDIQGLTGVGRKTITFAQAHDPLPTLHCDPTGTGSLFRFGLSLEEIYTISPGKD